MYNLNDVYYASEILGFDFKKFSPQDFLEGINIESEHGLVNSLTNITDDDLILTSKIALAHLNEFPNYYNSEYGIKMFEKFLKQLQ